MRMSSIVTAMMRALMQFHKVQVPLDQQPALRVVFLAAQGEQRARSEYPAEVAVEVVHHLGRGAEQLPHLGRVAPKHPVLPLVLVQLATTGALAALVGPFVEVQHFSAAPRLWAAVLYLAVFATLLAFGIQTWAQKILPPVRVALISALEPVFAALWAALLIGERLTLHEMAGGALIVVGVAVGEAIGRGGDW